LTSQYPLPDSIYLNLAMDILVNLHAKKHVMPLKNNLLRCLAFFLPLTALAHNPLQLWYTAPATQWEETLPLGNGRLGMMPDGGISHEKIVLNDITLWSGSPQDANNYAAHNSVQQIQQLLLEGRNDEAEALVNANFVCTGAGS